VGLPPLKIESINAMQKNQNNEARQSLVLSRVVVTGPTGANRVFGFAGYLGAPGKGWLLASRFVCGLPTDIKQLAADVTDDSILNAMVTLFLDGTGVLCYRRRNGGQATCDAFFATLDKLPMPGEPAKAPSPPPEPDNEPEPPSRGCGPDMGMW
jgi:hypothetical protein